METTISSTTSQIFTASTTTSSTATKTIEVLARNLTIALGVLVLIVGIVLGFMGGGAAALVGLAVPLLGAILLGWDGYIIGIELTVPLVFGGLIGSRFSPRRKSRKNMK